MLGNRILRARKALGLSLRDVAKEMALSHAAIKKYEDNKVTPASDVLLKLAKVLHVKVEYFFRPERLMMDNIRYRKHSNMPERDLEKIRVKILDKIEQRLELENLFPSCFIQEFSTIQFAKKIIRIDDVEIFAEAVRKQWGLGLEPILSLIEVLEERGIRVFEIDNQQYTQFHGLYAQANSLPVIVIGNHRPGDRQRFTLAHELGHLLLRDLLSKNLNEEACCNRFAGALLLPKIAIISKLGKHRNQIEPRELGLLKQEFGISMASVLHRIEDVKIISSTLYKKLRKEFEDRGWIHQEPGNPYPSERAYIFEQLVFHALAEDYIGEAKAAEFLNQNLKSFRALRMMEHQHAASH